MTNITGAAATVVDPGGAQPMDDHGNCVVVSGQAGGGMS